MDDEEDSWDFEGMVNAKKVASSGICRKLEEAQRVCEDGKESVSATAVVVIGLAHEGVKAKRKNATPSEQNADMHAELVQPRAANRSICRQLVEAKRRIAALKAQLDDAWWAIEKLVGESSRAIADL